MTDIMQSFVANNGKEVENDDNDDLGQGIEATRAAQCMRVEKGWEGVHDINAPLENSLGLTPVSPQR